MTMRKKTLIIFLAAVLTTALLLVGCGNNVKLVDFPATQTVEAQKLGDIYELRRTVADKNGNSYDLDADVIVAGGGSVNVVAAKFELTDPRGYVITYTADTGKNKITSVVTVPVYDGDDPVIVIDKPKDGIKGKAYTLPEITFKDYSQIGEKTVGLYKVDGDTLTEISLTEADGKYTFTPDAVGYYRIRAYAKDIAGNESTRTADFTVDTLLAGEVFNPASLNARKQLRSSSDPSTEYKFVSADENNDATYGGDYWLVKPNASGWQNTYLTPRLGISEYDGYDVIAMWIYAESARASASINNFVILGDVELNQGTVNSGTMKSNEWTLVEIPIDKFTEKIESQMLFAVSYSDDVIYGVRVGEITAKNTNYRKGDVFNPAADDVGTRISTSGATFTDTQKTVVPSDENSDAVYGGAYVQYTVSGKATDWGNVSVKPVFTREQYAEFDYVSAWIYLGQKAGSDGGAVMLVSGNVMLHRRYVKTGAWTKITLIKLYDGMTGTYADNVFCRNVTFGNDTAASTFDFGKFFSAKWAGYCDFIRIGEIKAGKFDGENKNTTAFFDPAAANVSDNVHGAGTVNTDGVENPDSGGAYNGACVSWSPKASGWQNLYITPTSGDWESLSLCQQIKIWVYVKTASGTKTDFELIMLNNASARQKITTDTWVELTLDIGLYIDYIKSKPVASASSGNPNFMTHNAWGGATVYIGTATAVNYV